MNTKEVVSLIIIPIYNDWSSVCKLLEGMTSSKLKFLLINDGSTQNPSNSQLEVFRKEHISILHLVRNVGHQRAIAIGLSYAQNHHPADYYGIMDGDGEDKLSALEQLIQKIQASGFQGVLFGSRAKRNESLGFKLGYSVYKKLFQVLSAQKIEFGHFCVFPQSLLKKITSVSEIWNHFPAAIIHSKISYDVLPLDRGTRIDGQSKMNFTSLVIHGLSAISVFNESVGVRAISAVFKLMLFVIVGISVVIGLKVFTTLAIPGWASIIGIALIIIAIQLFSIVLIFVFQLLGARTQPTFLPIRDYDVFVDYEEVLSDG